MSLLRRRWRALLLTLLAIPPALITTLGMIPAPVEPVLSPEEMVVGAAALTSDEVPVDAAFPEIAYPADNPPSEARVELGRLLFFDPVLSADDDISCASCHHPDLGLSDGLRLAKGAGGVELERHTPSLFEVAYASSLFWDGRADSLETQAERPLLHADEMAADPDGMVAQLETIEEYRERFAAAFPDDQAPLSEANVRRALAAYERTLLAHDTPWDRFMAGDESALTRSQQRGWALFRSGATGCYRCHTGALFTTGELAVTGVGGEDAPMKIPTLRNVALSAPYMHDGSIDSLEAVVDFYAGGAGEGSELRAFTLSAQERADLVDFFYALTDPAALPERPAAVPSGLPVVAARDNPGLAEAAARNRGSPAREDRPPLTLRVEPGKTIQSVMDRARPGDTIEISPGTYHERVVFDLDDITMRGIPDASGAWPLLDGRMALADGISASGDNLLFEQLEIRNYTGNGIIVTGSTGVTFRDLRVDNTSLYGVYPVKSTDVLIERVEASGIRDAGIYLGQSRNGIVRDNVVHDNVIGIEIENSYDVEVFNNHAYDNSTGIFVDLLPNLPSKASRETRVFDNLIEHNNLANFANEGEIGALVPSGTGILVLGADDVEVTENEITDNKTVGVAIFSTRIAFDEERIDVPPDPERVHVHDNVYRNNGYDPDQTLRDLGIDGADIIWDVSNWNNRFDEAQASSFPPVLPGSRWPDVARRAYWQVLNFVISRLG